MKIRWGRVLAAALLIEVILMTLFPLGRIITSRFGAQAYLVFEGIYALAVTFLVTMWLVRKIHERVILHGVLVGTVKQLIFFGLFIATGQLSSLTGFIARRGAVWFWLGGNGLTILATVLGALASEKIRHVRAKESVAVT
jgi:hypothetical protein